MTLRAFLGRDFLPVLHTYMMRQEDPGAGVGSSA